MALSSGLLGPDLGKNAGFGMPSCLHSWFHMVEALLVLRNTQFDLDENENGQIRQRWEVLTARLSLVKVLPLPLAPYIQLPKSRLA